MADSRAARRILKEMRKMMVNCEYGKERFAAAAARDGGWSAATAVLGR